MIDRAKMGRPPKPPSVRRSLALDVRIDEAERSAFRVAAEAAGLSLSDWVRSRLRDAARQELAGKADAT